MIDNNFMLERLKCIMNGGLFVQYTCQSQKQNRICQKRRHYLSFKMTYQCVISNNHFQQFINMKPGGGNGNPQQQSMNKLKQLCSQTEKFDKKIVGKDFLMGKYFDAQKSKPISKRQKKYAKSKIEKLLNIQQKLTGKERAYDFYLPLHQLWKSYTIDLLKNDKNQDSVCLKLLRADYHGAQITIIQSTIDSYIGLTGIIVNQSLKTFKIISQDNRIRILLKNQIVFQVKIMEKYFSVNGNCLIFRSTDRSKHKFKSRQAEKLNLKFMEILFNDSD